MARKKKTEDSVEKVKEKTEEMVGDTTEKAEKNALEIKEEVNEIAGIASEKLKEAIIELTEESEEDKKKRKKKEVEEKAKKFREELEKTEVKTDELKEQIEKDRKTLVPVEDYIKYGVYIGTKVITPHMRQYVYKRRNDGIAILNANLIDKRLKEMVKLLVKYNPQEFIIVGKREASWKAVKKFAELLGIKAFTKKYPAGILTNPKLPDFFETDMVFIVDPWLDKNALHDAKIVKKKVLGLCDTNNYTFGVDFFIPCNNKSAKSVGFMLYNLAKEYFAEKKIEKDIKLGDFVDEAEVAQG